MSIRKYLLFAAALIAGPLLSYAQGMGGYMLDTVYMLPEANVRAQFANDTDRYRYNQMKYYVTTILPYMNAATDLFRDIDAKVHEPELSRKDKRRYINEREDEMRHNFEEKVRKLNVTQGTLLVKLIARQTELNLYKILQEFKNPLVAVKWQAWARVNGFNLDRKYDPEKEKTLELIMEDLGYPLPAGYRQALYLSGQ